MLLLLLLLRSRCIETAHKHVTHVRLRRLYIMMRSGTRRSLLSTEMISTPSSSECILLRRLLWLTRDCEATHSIWIRILLHGTTPKHSERMSWWWHVITIRTRSPTAREIQCIHSTDHRIVTRRRCRRLLFNIA